MYADLRRAWGELTAPGAAFEITEVAVRGVKLRTYANAPGSVRDIWLGARAHGSRDYLVYGDERRTYEQAHRDTASVASWLVDSGVGTGDRVAIAMRNYPEWLIAYWATVSIGATAVGMNAWWTGPEMVFAMQDSTPKVTIGDA